MENPPKNVVFQKEKNARPGFKLFIKLYHEKAGLARANACKKGEKKDE
jgi:hypothetical protein